jgi:hypothetical protein
MSILPSNRRLPIALSGAFVDQLRRVLAAERDGASLLDESATALRDIENRAGAMLTALSPPEWLEFHDEDWAREHVHPWLSMVSVPLPGPEMNQFAFRDTRGRALSIGFRGLGAIQAAWANESWFQRPIGLGKHANQREQRQWEYLDFYMEEYFDYLIDDYPFFLGVLRQTVLRKDALFGMHLLGAKAFVAI